MFYDMLAVYSAVSHDHERRMHPPTEAAAEPVCSTWARHAATGEDQIVVQSTRTVTTITTETETAVIPYLIDDDDDEGDVGVETTESGGSRADQDRERLKQVDRELKALRERVLASGVVPQRRKLNGRIAGDVENRRRQPGALQRQQQRLCLPRG